MMSTLRSTDVPLAASMASRMHTAGRRAGGQTTSALDHRVGPFTRPRGGSRSRGAAPLGTGPPGGALHEDAVRIEQPDAGPEPGQVRQLDRAVVVVPVVDQ